MDMETLCTGIRLPREVFRHVMEFFTNSSWKQLESLIEGMTVPESAGHAYEELCSILGEDDMGMLACQLKAAAKVHDRYREMDIPDDIFYATMACFPRFLEETRRRTGKWCFDRAFWSYRQTSMVIFRIGELEYELCHDKKAISVHIPSDACFTPAAVDASLTEARIFLKRFQQQCEDYQFICHSWLLSPELGKLLPETSNILSFQRRFAITSVQPEEREFLQWLFEAEPDYPVEKLREDTSLRRSAKALLLSGGNIGAARGVMK